MSSNMPEPEAFVTHLAPKLSYKKINETINLYPFSDVHRHAPHCDVDAWKEHLTKWKADKNALYIGVGDYDDFMSGSERKKLVSSFYHESSRATLDNWAQEHVDELVSELSFMKGRLLGLVEGNHHFMFQDGTTSTQRMCRALECPYLGYMGFIRIPVDIGGHGKKTTYIDILAYHGRGAGRTMATSLRTMHELDQIVPADIYLSGHDHKKFVDTSLVKLKPTIKGGEVVMEHHKSVYARTGSFLKGYVSGKASYVAGAAMAPSDMGSVSLHMQAKRKTYVGDAGNRIERCYIDITGTA